MRGSCTQAAQQGPEVEGFFFRRSFRRYGGTAEVLNRSIEHVKMRRAE